jgi:hypothetical protein
MSRNHISDFVDANAATQIRDRSKVGAALPGRYRSEANSTPRRRFPQNRRRAGRGFAVFDTIAPMRPLLCGDTRGTITKLPFAPLMADG